MKRSIFSILITILIIVRGYGQQQTDTIRWLQESSFDLETTDPDSDIRNIPLDRILANVDLVLVGEATHGTKEFAQVKHRLFRYLVENLNFKYFFIEADFAAGLTVDNYICHNVGDPEEVLKNLRYFHIVNREGLELIKWMHAYNSTKGEKEQIRFFGIDCQRSENSFNQLKTYFSEVDSVFYRQISDINLTNNQSKYRTFTLDKKYPVLTLTKDTIGFIKNHLLTNKDFYVTISSQKQFKIAMRLVELLRQSNEISTSSDGYQAREEFMAANIYWALNEINPKPEKSFLWAHNMHVIYSEITQANTNISFGTLGKLLKNKFNEKVYSIGLDFNKGSFIANEIRPDTIVKKKWTLEEASENTFPYLLSKTNKEVLFIDFNSLQNQNLARWLKENSIKGHGIGAVYYFSHRFRRYLLMNNFNGLIFINTTREITLDLHESR